MSTVSVGFWNLQRLFDSRPSAIASELGISVVHGWNADVLDARITNISRAIRSLFDGNGPDLLGLAEVENAAVAQRLLTALERDDYGILLPDPDTAAAADTALLYSKDVFCEEPICIRSHIVHQRFPTCDILEVTLKLRGTGTELTVLVNHWPSRQEPHSDAFRCTTAAHCARLVQQHVRLSRTAFLSLKDTEPARRQLRDHWNRAVVVMGTLNEDPWSIPVRRILNAGRSLRAATAPCPFAGETLPSWRTYLAAPIVLFNPAWCLLSDPESGTCRIDGESRIHDQILLSRGLVTGDSGLKFPPSDPVEPGLTLLSRSILADADGSPRAFCPENRTGFSDHLPVGIRLALHTPETCPIDDAADQSDASDEPAPLPQNISPC